jgi:hypothetical protein
MDKSNESWKLGELGNAFTLFLNNDYKEGEMPCLNFH